MSDSLDLNLKLCKQAYIWKQLYEFLNWLQYMVNWPVSLHNKFFQICKVGYSTYKR